MADTALISSPRPRQEPRVLRPHQVKGRDAAARHLRRPGTRGLFVSATGTGKTLVAIRLVGTLCGGAAASSAGASTGPGRGPHTGPGRADRPGMAGGRPP
ncbi:DEAD/DEAH box helicase family protein [Streptomyces sp. NPDC006289]|uniref:DEAD/DEAH box helicase family protein n=1 Tax=Streptomyces sp. NPDC006289 TaxID=3156744 RepID=UPI0033A031F0